MTAPSTGNGRKLTHAERELRDYLKAHRWYAREARRQKFMRGDLSEAAKFAYKADCALALIQIQTTLLADEARGL